MNFKVFSLSGTSSLVIGKSSYQDSSSQSQTTNGVGSAYGDGSYINMSPYKSSVNDPNFPNNSYYPTPSNYYHGYQLLPQPYNPHYFYNQSYYK